MSSSLNRPLVTHVCTYDKSGGAAIAAWRLHQGLRNTGVESRMVARFRSCEADDVSFITSDMLEAADIFHRDRVLPQQPADSGYFSFSAVSIPLEEHPWIAAADVVHFHWCARFVSPEDIARLKLAGKTVFISLHDEWAFTGGCHYIGGTARSLDKWQGIHQIDSGLHALAKLELERKKRHFHSSGVEVIAPSRWMAREAEASGVFAPEQIHVVPYGFDLSIFHLPEEGPGDEVVLVFGCQTLVDPRKGYRELCEALVICGRDPGFAAAAAAGKIRLVTFGKPMREDIPQPVPVSHLGVLQEHEVAEILRGSSAFVCPTLDDNLPNVVMESLSCGCPVLGFSTGGVPDMVSDGVDGLLADWNDVHGLAKRLREFCLDEGLRNRLRTGARTKDFSCWTLATQAARMTDLYQSVQPAGFSNGGITFPEAPPEVDLEGQVLPHFATEIIRATLMESRARNERIRELQRKVSGLGSMLETEKAARNGLQAKLKKTNAEAERLAEEVRNAAAVQRKPAGIRKRLRRFWKSLRKRP